MKKEIIAEKSGVNKIYNIKFNTEYKKQEFLIHFEKEYTIGNTGQMKVFEIISEKQTKLKFIGRWDEKEKLLDIDIENIDKETLKKFRSGKKDYLGHRAKLIKLDPRTFAVHIEIGNTLYYKGEVSFSIGHILKCGPIIIT